MNEKIYIVHGYESKYNEEIFWIEEIFKDEEQAKACCKYLGIVDRNKEYSMTEHEISTYNYISSLEQRKEWVDELFSEQDNIYYN